MSTLTTVNTVQKKQIWRIDVLLEWNGRKTERVRGGRLGQKRRIFKREKVCVNDQQSCERTDGEWGAGEEERLFREL